MADIHDIERIIYFMPYLKPETWYVVAACVSVYLIHIFYLALSERHRKYREKMMAASGYTDPYAVADKWLASLDLLDEGFFAKLHLLVRTYLENVGKVENAVKKTTDEVIRDLPSDDLRILLETCSTEEYAPAGRVDRVLRERMHSLARTIIDGIERPE